MRADLILLALLAFFAAAVLRPPRMRCLPGFHADGVRRSGYFECARPYGCRDMRGPRGGWTSTCDGEDRYGGKLWCTGGTEPILDRDGCTVGCQRGGWP